MYNTKYINNNMNLIYSNDFTILIINGPNKDNPLFYQEIKDLISNNLSDYLIFCGDLNVSLNPQKD